MFTKLLIKLLNINYSCIINIGYLFIINLDLQIMKKFNFVIVWEHNIFSYSSIYFSC